MYYNLINEEGEMWNKMKMKQLKLKDLNIILATREIARFVVQIAIDRNCKIISFNNIDSVSRSFLDQLIILSKKNHLEIVDMSKEIRPLFDLIKKSHRDRKMYAPKIKVHVSNTTFA